MTHIKYIKKFNLYKLVISTSYFRKRKQQKCGEKTWATVYKEDKNDWLAY